MDKELVAALWAVFHDKELLRQHRAELEPDVLPRGPSRYLVALALDLWEVEKALLTPAAIELIADAGEAQQYGTTVDEAFDLFASVYERYDDEDIVLLRATAIKLFRTLRLGQQLDEASDALDKRDLEGADKALRDGHKLIHPTEKGLRLFDFKAARSIPVKAALPTGFAILDKPWMGGLHVGQLGTVIAPWNTGKSMILPWFAGRALRVNKRVLYYTTEVDESTILARTVSSIVRQPINTMDVEKASRGLSNVLRLHLGLAGSDEDDALESFFEVRYRDALSLGLRDIESDLDELDEEGHHIHMIIFDGDDLKSERKYDRGYDMWLNIYTDLAALAQRRQVGIWTAAQGDRKSADLTKITGQHIADSIAKIRKADMALGLQMKPHWLDDEGDHYMVAHVAKDRYYGTRGMTFRTKVHFGFGTDGYAAFDGSEEVKEKDVSGAD